MKDGEVDISGIDKAELLAALYNGSRAQGMGSLDPRSRQDMTIEQAKAIIDRGELSFDYLQGRVMKVGLEGDSLETWLYNRDLGQGAAERIVEGLRQKRAAA